MPWRPAALFVVVAAAAGLTAGSVAAQGTRSPAPAPAGTSAAQTPTFRVGTDLLTVDVSVVDSSGHPVEGLTPADFTIKIDGKVRHVTAAHLDSATGSTSQASGLVGSSDVAVIGAPRAAVTSSLPSISSTSLRVRSSRCRICSFASSIT